MAHIRTQIRGMILTALQGMATPRAVYDERRVRVDTSLVPLVILSLGQSDVVDEGATMEEGWTLETDQTVTIELHTTADTGADVADELDQLELEAEAALSALNGGSVMTKIGPTSSTFDTSVEGDRVIGVRTLSWTATYSHVLGAADTPEV